MPLYAEIDEELHKELRYCSVDTGISVKELTELALIELLRQYKGEGITINEE